MTENDETKPRKAPLRRPGVLRFSGVELLVSLLLAIVATPFIESMKYGAVIEPLLMTAVLLLAVLAVGGNRKTLTVAIILVVPAVIGRWIAHLLPKTVSGEIHWVAELVFLGFVVGNLFRFIMRAPRVNVEVMCAGVSGYLLLAMIWIVAYRLVADAVPDAFLITAGPPTHRTMDAFTAFYFSFATITTIGYGEIVPVANVARMLAVMEAVAGMFYMAIVISRLVALYTTNPPQAAPGDLPPPAA